MDRNKNAGNSRTTVAETNSIPTGNALILTRFKSQTHRDFTYPIGAELLSEHLRGIQHFETAHLAFSCEASSEDAVSRKQLLEGKDEYSLITARVYSTTTPVWTQGWTLHIYPVRRDFKKIAKAALATYALPMRREWLAGYDVTGSYFRNPECALVFAPMQRIIYLRDRNNDDLHPTPGQISDVEKLVLSLQKL